MRPRSPALKTFGALLGVGLLAFTWFALGPTQLGGPATYALIQGDSMEPLLHQGDLAIVRSKRDYAVGDVVAYRSAELDRLVLHRIIERDGARFSLQGDSNDFVDSGQPTEDQIAGELAVRIPNAGSIVGRLQSPAGYAILLGLVGATLVGVKRTSRSRGGTRTNDARRSKTLTIDRAAARRRFDMLAGVAGGAVVVFALVAVVAYTRPAVETTTDPELYEQTGTFSYSAEVGETPVYNSSTASDGDALFTALVDEVDIQFAYALNAAETQRTSGTASLTAIVSDGKGLKRDLELVPPRTFVGGSVTLDARVALRKLRRLIRRIEQSTGAVSNNYFVTIAPSIDVAGVVGQSTIEDSFSPELVFLLDDSRLALAQTSALDDSANALTRSQPGSGAHESPATIGVLGLEATVEDVRRIAVIGALASFMLLLGALALTRLPRRGERDVIAARHGDWLVHATGRRDPAERRVELTSMDELVRVAELRGHPVLEIDEAGRTLYVVDDGRVEYCYSTEPEEDRDDPVPRASTAPLSEEELSEWLPLMERLAHQQETAIGSERDD